MELKNINNFAILLINECNIEKDIIGVIEKISLRRQVHYYFKMTLNKFNIIYICYIKS